MIKQINFDLDGTLANLYGVDGWLEDILAQNTRPYEIAEPLINLQSLARVLHRLQRNGYKICIISWLSRTTTEDYDYRVTQAKLKWLEKHLASVDFDEINIVAYGTPKQTIGQGILFDDEKPNRDNWNGIAYDVDNILEVLKNL